ncbi:molecular chaperone [Rosenbergiella sp. S61]|uniref:Molecular chaperone n=1 Tax=Rosenbergiella gaditana TaxID=2726987 RepID=A0ABS5SY14_9GAMM|nr:molecular chaperone [Rosenbergiella gaditana]MBT0724142.1 molecular chaperone [Rosenbergiella gaditana]
MSICRLNKIFALLLPLSLSFAVNAGVVIGGTRLIYNQDDSQAAISVNNPDDKAYLIQSWINKDSENDDNDDTFLSTPPIFKLGPKSQNSVRVVYTGKPLPQDRESVFWLNIKSIPSTNPNAQNQLLITVKSKMKIFYRPSGLTGDPSLAYKSLEFINSNGKLRVINPSPYNVSLYKIALDGTELKNITMVPPKDQIEVSINNNHLHSVIWSAINDFGGVTSTVSKIIK